jgi:DNA-binding IclR family transcriptional regulator
MSDKKMVEDAPVRAVLNAVDVLEYIAKSRQGVGVREIARELRMTPATTSRLLTTLRLSHMLEQGEGGRYFVGPRLHSIAQTHRNSVNLNAVSEPFLRDLVKQTGETAFLGVLDEASVVVINRLDSPQPLRMAAELGTREPANLTALGKVMFSHLPEDELERRLLQLDFAGAPATSSQSAEEFLRCLEETRLRGWGLDDEEHVEGVRCVACGIKDADGRIISAISVSGPSNRLTDERIKDYVPIIRAAAAGISRRLGYAPGLGATTVSG